VGSDSGRLTGLRSGPSPYPTRMNYGIVAVSDQPELAPLLATWLLDECRHPATTTLSERLHSSGGEVARNDRHGRRAVAAQLR
jgi:hypothetical protein